MGEGMTTENTRGQRKVVQGIVTSDKMDKTRTVQVVRQIRHPLYKKFVKHTKKYMVHDEANDSHIGDTVLLMETRPLSKNKCWRLVEVVERAR